MSALHRRADVNEGPKLALARKALKVHNWVSFRRECLRASVRLPRLRGRQLGRRNAQQLAETRRYPIDRLQ